VITNIYLPAPVPNYFRDDERKKKEERRKERKKERKERRRERKEMGSALLI